MRKPNMPTMGDILRRKKDQFSTRIGKTGNWIGKQAQSTGSVIGTGIGKTGAYLRERLQPQTPESTATVIAEAPNNVNFNKKLKQKNDVMKEYLQVQGILSRMSPEKRNVYSNIVGGLYEPHLKPYIKQETLSDVLGGKLPEEWKQYGNMPIKDYLRVEPALVGLDKQRIANRTLADVYPDGNYPEVFKGMSPNTNILQAIKLSDTISGKDMAIIKAIVQMLGLNMKFGE